MMELSEIKKIGVVGAGTMGQGIAQVAALNGFEVVLFDIHNASLTIAQDNINKNLDKGIERGKVSEVDKQKALALIEFSTEISHVVADVIIEAIVENLEAKKELFARLEEFNTEEAVLASNTSSIPITRIAKDLKHPGRLVGMHFFNPAHIMKLVEVIAGASSAKATVETVYALAEKLGKKAVVAKDSPGFIVNRVARHFYVEGLKVLEEGVSDVEGIDRLVEASGFRMGPFRLMDLIGVDTNYSVTETMFNSFHQDAKFRPSRIQQQKVDAGHYGRKSGKGFYDY
jgi:3-hydroxybutyryl-CoA dehydrogenase